jgi:hypothetical protein
VICGHTHRPTCGGFGTPLYFNAGSCLYPGYITGLELLNGEIRLVKWAMRPATKQKKPLHFERQLLALPRKLSTCY